MSGSVRRLLVVSHPAVLTVNQEVYAELARRGIEVTIVVPANWRHEYSSGPLTVTALPELEGRVRPLAVALPGHPQRHFHLSSPWRVLSQVRPDVVLIEAEPFSAVAAQWSLAAVSRGLAFGVQCAENLDRPLPAPVRASRERVLARADFVAARSESAAAMAARWGAAGAIAFAPHAVPVWDVVSEAGARRAFTVGYAGRLVPEKGLDDLLAAMRRLDAPVELVLAGDGEMRSRLDGQAIPGSRVRVLTGLRHDQMAGVYAGFDVLAVPSRTTPTWKEQFGRVIVEALWCGVPVVGSDSGEIPWLLAETGGGLTYPEGDVDALADRLAALRADPAQRDRFGATGRAAVQRLFTVPRAADALQGVMESGYSGHRRLSARQTLGWLAGQRVRDEAHKARRLGAAKYLRYTRLERGEQRRHGPLGGRPFDVGGQRPIVLDASSLNAVRGHWLQSGLGIRELRAFQRLAPGHSVMLDIGAAEGIFAAAFCAITGGRALAFEPSPEMSARLDALMKRNPGFDITHVNVALAGADGAIATQTVADGQLRAATDGALGARQTVPARTLDGVMQAYALHPDFAKIDVEGMEIDVLEGGAVTLGREVRTLMLEVHRPFLTGGRSASDLQRALRRLGFALFTLEMDPIGDLEGFLEAEPEISPGVTNVVCRR
jgi:FkbM family methyltransferase